MNKTTAIVGTLTLGAALAFGSAHAAVYQGHFDPVLFEGDASFEVPEGCVIGDGVIFTGSGTCSTVDLLSATVFNQPNPPITGTLTFAPVSDAVIDLRWIAGVLVGVDTDIISFAPPNGTFDNPDGYSIRFNSGANFEESVALALAAPQAADSGATVELFERFCSEGCDFSRLGDPATQEPFVRVPEPGGLALIAAGMLAGWVARRRKH